MDWNQANKKTREKLSKVNFRRFDQPYEGKQDFEKLILLKVYFSDTINHTVQTVFLPGIWIQTQNQEQCGNGNDK